MVKFIKKNYRNAKRLLSRWYNSPTGRTIVSIGGSAALVALAMKGHRRYSKHLKAEYDRNEDAAKRKMWEDIKSRESKYKYDQ